MTESKVFLFWRAPKSLQMVTSAMKKSYDEQRQRFKKQRHYFASKSPSNQSYDFSSSHVWMWELDYKKAERWRIDAF